MHRSASLPNLRPRQLRGLRGVAVASLCSGLFLLSGCRDADTGPETVPVSGTITVDGKPIAGAKVTFLHETFAAFGETDASGKYQLAPGAVPGENKIVLSKWEGGPPGGEDAGFDDEQLRMMAEAGGPDAPKQIFPREVTNAMTTNLTFSVPEEGSEAADFDL
ncbi:carboxypeptidase-like regulatory domain-containing protein [Candidatus Laterigemmans baculatus]|uniref:carboxypeptidase-like regulatory domain-containing protein n=1 Tax=Candidatus Laterigemmans baculatus TaxID=2770505 RepID=UPI0013DA2D12|nr:carboxypeptidase-like regulatory domain-containing protein [Candidatus Laterigemmans baculatus]